MLGLQARTVGVFLLAAGLGFPLHFANAALMQVANRSGLGANVTIDWSVFGPPGTILSCHCDATVGPLTVGLNSSDGAVSRQDEGLDYIGNFAIGNALVVDPNPDDVMTVIFNPPIDGPPVAAVGTQIQPSSFTGGLTGPFTATMRVRTNDIGSHDFSVSGNSTRAEDDSAPFLGVVSTTNDITGLTFLVAYGNPIFPLAGNVAINQMDVRLVAEPGSALVLGTAMLLLIGLLRVCARSLEIS